MVLQYQFSFFACQFKVPVRKGQYHNISFIIIFKHGEAHALKLIEILMTMEIDNVHTKMFMLITFIQKYALASNYKIKLKTNSKQYLHGPDMATSNKAAAVVTGNSAFVVA